MLLAQELSWDWFKCPVVLEDRPLVTRVILVRHGESSYNVERRVQGYCDDSTLTDRGQADALSAGKALQEIRFDAAYCSSLRRAHDTANLILSCLEQPPTQPLQPVDALKEINLMLWEALLFSDVEKKYPEQYQAWREAPHQLCMQIPDESGQLVDYYPVVSLFDRARQFWQDFLPQHQNQTVLLVGHSGINRALIATAIGLEPHHYQFINQANCGISVLNFAGGWGDMVQIESMNQTIHLGDALPKPKGSLAARLLLVRHGETDWNRQKRFQGQIDVALNEMGQRQAEQAANFLAAVPIRYAISSPLLRPKETAEIILQNHLDVTLELVDDLKEIGHGLWEGKLEAEIEQEFPGELAQWQKAPETVQMPEGENLQDVWIRAKTAWEAIVTTARSREPGITLVVAHDAINKAILCQLFGLDASHFWNFKQGNGAVSVIDYAQDTATPPVLMAMNITSHLDGGVLDKTVAGAL